MENSTWVTPSSMLDQNLENPVDICPTFNLTLCRLLTNHDDCLHCGCYYYRGMLTLGMVVTIIITFIGTIGNFLSLATLAFQFYLPKKMRHVEKLTADTVLIMNLSLADLCYCAISLPLMFVIYKNLHEEKSSDVPVLSMELCIWAAFIRYTNAITEWTCLGLMALERCVTIYRFQRKMSRSKWFTPYRTIAYSIFVWIFGIAAQTPTLLKKFGEFGYNKYTLKCDFVPTTARDSRLFVTPRVFFFSLESAVPCCLIFVGYLVILFQVYSSERIQAKNTSLTSATQLRLALRRSKTTRVIMVLLTVYLVCVVPMCTYNVVLEERALGQPINQMIGIGVYCVYWLQYALNNFIYVVNNERYREAYKQLFCFLMRRDIQPPPKLHRFMNSSSTNKHRGLRFRTPSEMVLDEVEFSQCKKPEKNTIAEVPILVFPKASLHAFYSNVSIKKALKGRNMKNIYKKKHIGENHMYKKGPPLVRRNTVKIVEEILENRCKLKRTMSV